MEKFFLPVILIFLKFAFNNVFGCSIPLFEPLIACAVLYAFFHSFDFRQYILYTLFCAFLAEGFSSGPFGVYILSFLAVSLGVAAASVIVYRENPLTVFPVVFLGTFLNNVFVLALRSLVFNEPSYPGTGLFLLVSLLGSLGNTLLVYLWYLFAKKCGLEFTG